MRLAVILSAVIMLALAGTAHGQGKLTGMALERMAAPALGPVEGRAKIARWERHAFPRGRVWVGPCVQRSPETVVCRVRARLAGVPCFWSSGATRTSDRVRLWSEAWITCGFFLSAGS